MKTMTTKERIREEKRQESIMKEREQISTPRAELIIKLAYMSDLQYWMWTECETTAEATAFMKTIPMPVLSKDQISIFLEKAYK